jgi:hypothetical protein
MTLRREEVARAIAAWTVDTRIRNTDTPIAIQTGWLRHSNHSAARVEELEER